MDTALTCQFGTHTAVSFPTGVRPWPPIHFHLPSLPVYKKDFFPTAVCIATCVDIISTTIDSYSIQLLHNNSYIVPYYYIYRNIHSQTAAAVAAILRYTVAAAQDIPSPVQYRYKYFAVQYGTRYSSMPMCVHKHLHRKQEVS